jgi:hypothetical protein
MAYPSGPYLEEVLAGEVGGGKAVAVAPAAAVLALVVEVPGRHRPGEIALFDVVEAVAVGVSRAGALLELGRERVGERGLSRGGKGQPEDQGRQRDQDPPGSVEFCGLNMLISLL